MQRLSGKIAIITGAASGMGAAQARLFVAEGASVVIADVNEAGHQLAADLGARAAFVRHDVASEDSWDNVVGEAERQFGIPNILINTAGVTSNYSLDDTTTAEFERMVRINQIGPFLGIRRLADPMVRAGGGAVVNIASVGAIRALAGLTSYASSKAGLLGMSKVAAKELAPRGIRVNTILPGTIDTPIISPDMRSILEEQVAPHLPIRRVGTVEEIAAATLFLASDEASYIVGAELTVDGGMAL